MKYGRLYERLLKPNEGDQLGCFSKQLQPCDLTTAYPLVLRLWAETEIDQDETKLCFSHIMLFIVRRSICGLTTKYYNKHFVNLIRRLETEGFSSNRFENLLTRDNFESTKFPTDEEFERSWVTEPMYQKLPAH